MPTTRNVEHRRTFRITAVRRVEPAGLLDLLARRRRRGVVEPLADEEIIHALWRNRAEFEARLRDVTQRELRVKLEVTLEDLQPAHSVLGVITFVVDASVAFEDLVGRLGGPVTVAVAEILRNQFGDVAAAAIPIAAPAGAAVSEPPTAPWGRIAPVLGAVASGIGVIGFVTFVGGVIVFARLQAAGFPAEAALSVIPAQDLLVIGSATLVPEVLLGAGVVAVLFLGHALAIPAARKRLSPEENALVAQQASRLGAVAMAWYVAAALTAALVPRAVVGLGGAWETVAFAVGAALLALLVGTIAHVTSRFAYLAVAVFLAFGVYLTFLAYARARSANQARGAVVIRDNKKATVGLFVAEGANRVYLARVNLGDSSHRIIEYRSRLIGISKDQISDLAVGAPKPPAEAVAQGRALARELCALEPKVKAPATATATTTTEDCWSAAPGEPQPER